VEAVEAALLALRWVAAAAVPADGGLSWPETREPGSPLADDLYIGTAGVLVAFAEAKLSGIGEFDSAARGAVGRLETVAAAAGAELLARTRAADDDPLFEEEFGLYTGLAGRAAALRIWAAAAGDERAATAARSAMADVAAAALSGRPLSSWRDVIAGEAGILLTLLDVGCEPAPATILAERLAAKAVWTDGAPDWYARPDIGFLMPNFSHGAAGIGCALAAAGATLDRPDLIEVADEAARRLVRLGSRPDGTIAVPTRIPPNDGQEPVSYGWCHGPTGTLRLFELLDQVLPGEGWQQHADSCRRAVRESGLPARRYPGFWDNLGQCCGTAGVGEMALDRYQETGEAGWLEWSGALADDVLGRSITDADGVRWSHTEHRASPPELPPSVGWMQGAAGISGWLLRLARVRRDREARRLPWPDRPRFGAVLGQNEQNQQN
jgi:lantibiotic modifying enzyme